MDDPSLGNPAYLPLSDQQLSEIDELCDRFDQELHNGQEPRIETFLADAPEAARDGLLAELLAMEIEYITQQGSLPERDGYIRRFPQQQNVIVNVLAREATTQVPGAGTISIPVSVPPVLANFRLIEELGTGGMGVVWLAEQDEPVKRRVALKLIKAELTSKDVLARFDAEKQAVALMDHPNIARVLDAGTTDESRPYFVMELVEGVPITQYCDDNKLSVDERLNLFVLVCKAVQHAHQKGIVHRDLKPSNVLVTVIDGVAIPKVIDFGLAKAVEKNPLLSDMTMMTEFGKIVGTVQYMAPEQAELKAADTEDVDTRTDVYSLGVMLYELLTGSTPLDAETLGENALLKILEIIREQDPPRPSNRLSSSSHEATSAISDLRQLHPARLRQLLQGELDWVVMKALEKKPDRRYQTANDLAQDLANYLTGATITARPPSTWYQLQKFAKRNRGLVAATIAVGLALVIGIIGTGYGLIQANRKTELAEDKTREANEQRGKAETNEERAIEAEGLAEAEAQRARDSEASAKFQLAVARFDANRAVEARRLLNQVPPEYRDTFEWNYSKRRFQGSDVTCYGHTSQTYGVAFTPDGMRVVSANSDHTIKEWDATSGSELRTLRGPDRGVKCVAVSPDGTRMVSGSFDKSVRLRNTESGEVIRTMSGHSGWVNCVAFSPDGERIASASEDKTIKLWDATTGEEILTISAHKAGITGLAFSPDGRQLSSSSERDGSTRIWDSESGEQITIVRNGRLAATGVAFSPDGTRLVTISYGRFTLWDTKSWQPIIEERRAHDREVNCVAFSPDGTQFATGANDPTIKTWDTRTGKQIASFCGHASSVHSIAYNPDGSRLASGSHDQTVKIWDVRGKSNALTLRGKSRTANVAFSPDGRQFAWCGENGTVILCDAETNEIRFRLSGHANTQYVVEISFSQDGARLVSAGYDHTVRVWDTNTGEEVAALKGHNRWVRSVSFSPDGTQFASASWDGTAKLWNAVSHKETATLKGHRGGLYCVAFSPDGMRVATTSSDRTIRLWDAQTGAFVKTFKGHTDRVRSVTFGPRGERIVSAGNDAKVRVWDVATGRQVVKARVNSVVFETTLSPDGRLMATAGTDRGIRLFDAHSGQELMTLGTNGGQGVRFSPDGTRLAATVAGTNMVRIWDAPQQHETTLLNGHTDNVTEVTFSADGSRIYSESDNEKLVWDLPIGILNRNAPWDPPEDRVLTSPDGRWYVTAESNSVVLVDLDYKNTPNEAAYRKAKARFDPFWHESQANAATAEKNWYAATFHYALLTKHDPDQTSYYDGLASSFDELQSQFKQQSREIEPYLVAIVKESLNLPPADERLNPGFEEPRIRQNSFELRWSVPGWKTTGKRFEIWSSGLFDVDAYAGVQFAELNAGEEGTLYRESTGIERDAVIEFSFAHRGRNGDDTLKLTIIDLGPDNIAGGDDDTELFSKKYTTGKNAWAVYDSTTEPVITALGNKVRFAYRAVSATGKNGPDKTYGNFLDAAYFGVGVVSARQNAFGLKRLQAFLNGGESTSNFLGMKEQRVGIPDASPPDQDKAFVLKVEKQNGYAVLTNRAGKYVTAQGEAVVLTYTLEEGSRWVIRNPLKTDLNPVDGWFSLESAGDPQRYLRHYSHVAYAHKKSELTPGQAVLFPADASWKFIDAQ